MLLLTSSLGIAVGAFFLASIVEAEVHRENILSGLKKLLEKDYLLKLLTQRTLLKLCQNPENSDNNAFLKLYDEHYKYCQALKKIDGHSAASQKKLDAAEERLGLMERYFAKKILSQDPDNYDPLVGDVSNYVDIKKFKRELTTKLWLIRASWIISATAGIGTGFITGFAAYSGVTTFIGFLGFTATSTVLASTIFPLAILGGIAYVYSTFNTIHKIIADESIQKKWHEAKIYFQQQDPEHPYSSLLKKIGLGLFGILVISVVLFATASTGGTWWYGVQHGAKLVPYLAITANYIRAMTVPFVALAAFLFTFENSLESIWQLQKLFAKTAIREMIQPPTEEETWLESINPFRFIKSIVTLPLKIIVFLGHIISVGAMADRIDGIPPVAATVIGGITESAEDSHYVLPKNDSDGFIGAFVRFLLLPISLLDGIWRYAFSRKTASECFRSALDRRRYNPVLPEEPQSTLAWKKQEVLLKIEDQRTRYHKAIGKQAKLKHREMQQLYRSVAESDFSDTSSEGSENATFSTLVNNQNFTEISKNRYCLFAREKTSGKKFLENIQQDYENIRVKTSSANNYLKV